MQKDTELHLDKIRGSLIGGAAGDALGYPIEFLGEDSIFSRYGEKGIQEYEPDLLSGKALISDDTQMTLFTTNGILVADTSAAMRGIGGAPHDYIAMSYQDWLRTQEMSFEESKKLPKSRGKSSVSLLSDVPELYFRRSLGNTCIAALMQQRDGKSQAGDFIDNPQNNIKGCGGVMRVAPLALKAYPHVPIKDIDRERAETAAIFAEDEHLKELTDIIDKAVMLSENREADLDNIHRIGERWVVEETA